MNGIHSTKLINNSYTLWSYTTSQCLSQVPFSITLPTTIQDGESSPALPPSYRYKREGFQELKLLRVKYQLHFIVTRVRHQKLQDIWPKKQQSVYLLTSIAFHLLISYSASSSLSNMFLEHVHCDLLSLLLAFSHLSKRPQRNGIRQ